MKNSPGKKQHDGKENLPPTLVVDSNGTLGVLLAQSLPEESSVLCVSKATKRFLEKNIHTLGYAGKLLSIPDYAYGLGIFVYRGEEEVKAAVKDFIARRTTSATKLILLVPYFLEDDTFLSGVLSDFSTAKIILYGDLIGQGVQQEGREGFLDAFLLRSAQEEKMLLPGNGTAAFRPVFVTDAVEAVVMLIKEEKKGRLFSLFPQEKTILSIAREIKKRNPLLQLDFAKSKEVPSLRRVTGLADAQPLFEADYPAGKKIVDVFLQYQKIEKVGGSKSLAYKTRSSLTKQWGWLGLLMLFLLFLPAFLTIAATFFGIYQLKAAFASLEKGNILVARREVDRSYGSFGFASKTMGVVVTELSLVGQGSVAETLQKDIEKGKAVSQAGLLGMRSLENFQAIFLGLASDPEKEMRDGINYIKDALVLLQVVEVDSGSTYIPKEILSSARFASTTMLLSSLVGILPDILGFPEKRYALLFQNNMELRPGGGFIGSYGLTSVKQGKVGEFTIYDVYDADGQLKGHIEPPFPIRRFLPSEHWYLRDSNFDPDFEKNASLSAFFLHEEVGENIDGVIAIDTSFVRDLLGVLGDVWVPEYDKTVNRDNFYLYTQTLAEKGKFPGSTQKKSFLSSLFQGVVRSFKEKKVSPISLSALVVKGLEEKHLQVVFADPAVQSVLRANNLSTSIPRQQPGTITDFVGISEANLGVNKANYFVTRKVFHDVAVGENGSVSAALTLHLKNASTKDSWPGGEYKNFIRFLLPKDAALTEIVIDGKSTATTPAITDPLVYEDKNFSPPRELEVLEEDIAGKQSFGFLVSIPVFSQKTIQVRYRLPSVSPEKASYTYGLTIMKQPGIDSIPFSFSMRVPSVYRVVEGKGQALPLLIEKDTKGVFSTELSRDSKVSVSVARK